MSEILIVDDDSQVLDVLSEMLRLEGHTVSTAENGEVAATCMENQSFDLIITDLIMPEKEGLETIADMRNRGSNVPIIAISGGGRVGPMDYLETARFIGADAALAKPFSRDEFITVVTELLDDRRGDADAMSGV